MHRFPRLSTALDYAAAAHQSQVRKGTTIPYLSHLIGVTSLVLEHGGDEDQAIAGLLHDVLEDCGLQHEEAIRDAFGDRVLEIVRACTDGVPDSHGEKPPWRERKAAYLKHLADAPEDALLVSACDKLHNARAIATDLAGGIDVFARFTGRRGGTLWYYRSLVQIFAARLGGDRPLVLDLAATVARMAGANQITGSNADFGVPPCACCLATASSQQFETFRNVGIDETDGRYAEVKILRCVECQGLWLRYFVEYEAFSRSGRWARGSVSEAEATAITPAAAGSAFEHMLGYLYGGSYFGSSGSRRGRMPWGA